MAGVAKVGQDRLLLSPSLLDRAAELGQCDHRDVQFARQALEAAGDLADLFDSALDPSLVAHQLEVVDDDQAEALFELVVKPARLGANFEGHGLPQ